MWKTQRLHKAICEKTVVLVAALAAAPVSLAQARVGQWILVLAIKPTEHDVGLIGASHASQGGRITNSYVPTEQVG